MPNSSVISISKLKKHASIILHERDVLALHWIAEQYAISLDHLQLLLGRYALAPTKTPGTLSLTRVRHTVERWRRAGLVATKKILASQPTWVYLTNKGLAELGLTWHMYEPRAGSCTHLYYINQVRLMAEAKGYQWKSERVLNQFPATGERRHRPDAEVTTATDGPFPIEVEITRKNEKSLSSILRTLLQQYSVVWYFVMTDIKPYVIQVIQRQLPPEAQPRIRIYDL